MQKHNVTVRVQNSLNMIVKVKALTCWPWLERPVPSLEVQISCFVENSSEWSLRSLNKAEVGTPIIFHEYYFIFQGDENWLIFIKWRGELKYDRIPSNNLKLHVLWVKFKQQIPHGKLDVARVSDILLYFVLCIWGEERILISLASNHL